MTLPRIAAVLAAVVAISACAPLLRTEPLIRGTIVGIGSSSLEVRHKSGRIVRVLIAPTTTVASDTPSATAPILRPGLRTTITLEGSTSPFVARQVQVFGSDTR